MKIIFSRKRNKIILICIAITIIIISIIMAYIKNNHNDVDIETRSNVEKYIYQKYGIECKVKNSSYHYNESRFYRRNVILLFYT